MIIYNTTFHISDDVHDECLMYLKKEYIPKALAESLLHSPRLALIHAQYEEHGTSYSLQFGTKNPEMLELWMESIGQNLQEEMTSRFGDKACGFMTILEEVEI